MILVFLVGLLVGGIAGFAIAATMMAADIQEGRW
jgi:hypothetical protein